MFFWRAIAHRSMPSQATDASCNMLRLVFGLTEIETEVFFGLSEIESEFFFGLTEIETEVFLD